MLSFDYKFYNLSHFYLTMNEEHDEHLDSGEAIERIEPLVQDFLKTSQESLIDEIENIISNSYYGYDDIARAIAEKIEGKTIFSIRWSTTSRTVK